MRATDLSTHELLDLDPAGGIIRFAGERALLIDAVAIGFLRKHLIHIYGLTATRRMLTQFGFAHGWRMADILREQFKWSQVEDWRNSGPRIGALEGIFRVAPGGEDPLSEQGAILIDSVEAEQHLLNFGLSQFSICWTISGLLSGYLSRTEEKEIVAIENQCVSRGHAYCQHKARLREEWTGPQKDELHFFEFNLQQNLSLEASLRHVSRTLKAAEKTLQRKRKHLLNLSRDDSEPSGIVSKSEAMRATVDIARRVARIDSTILITGESGSGKEKIARLIHEQSTRVAGPFIAVNCGAITETLLESELFGHIRGAFTGAAQDRVGLFEAANHGTLFLDEIGDISQGMQVKLLRVLQEREVRRVGDNKVRHVDVRVLAATNRDLASRVSEGHFRADLYYRIKVVDIYVPSLRKRRADILPLARVLLGEAALRLKRKITGISPAAVDQLLRYQWPGNVRELENAMERAVALTRGTRVELEDLPEEVRELDSKSVFSIGNIRRLEDVEKEYILAALERNGGNQLVTAKDLGIGTATLYRRLKHYGLIADRPSSARAHTSGH